jgi:hypothetical protein
MTKRTQNKSRQVHIPIKHASILCGCNHKTKKLANKIKNIKI